MEPKRISKNTKYDLERLSLFFCENRHSIRFSSDIFTATLTDMDILKIVKIYEKKVSFVENKTILNNARGTVTWNKTFWNLSKKRRSCDELSSNWNTMETVNKKNTNLKIWVSMNCHLMRLFDWCKYMHKHKGGREPMYALLYNFKSNTLLWLGFW